LAHVRINWRLKAILPVAGVLWAGLLAFLWVTVEDRNRVILVAAGGALAIVAMVLIVLAVLIQRPLIELRRKIAQVRDGDLTVTASFADYDDDLGDLGRDFNEMVRRLRENVEEHKSAEDEIRALNADLERRGAATLLRDVELPLVGVLARMERTGIAADTDHLAAMSATLHGEVKAAEQAAFAVTGHEFNLGSPKQLQEVLFTELGLPKTKRIKTGYTTDSDALTSLLAQTGHPVLEHLLRYRDVAKLKSIVDSLIPMAGEDGRIHTTFNQMIAATGRLSSTDPNLQNIPIRTEEGRGIRRAFVVGEGYETLLTADYSQIELRIMAHLSGDEALIAAFESGHDFHAATASRVFGLPPEQVNGELRNRIKVMNYGLAYGLSAFGLSSQLHIPADEARALMDGYFSEFGGVRDYLRDVVARARQEGYTETMFGRRRYLPDLNSDNRQRREMAERMALNAPIQGSAADIIKMAMLAVDRAIHDRGLKSRMLLQVHDELIFEVAPGEFEALRDLVSTQMANAADLRVPLEVSIGSGSSWWDAAH